MRRIDDDEWLSDHLPAATKDPVTPPVMAPSDATRVRQNIYKNDRTIGPATPGNLPLPAAAAPESREGWLMSQIADQLPVVSELRSAVAGVVAGHQLAQSGHPLLGAAAAAFPLLPMGGSIAKMLVKGAEENALGRIAKAAIQLPDGSIHWGSSHATAIDAARAAGALPDWRNPRFDKILGKSVEGFVDEHGNFLTRDETTQRLQDLGAKISGPGMSSEELRFLSPKKRDKLMAPANELPFRGERAYDETFPRTVADSAIMRALPAANGLDDAARVLKQFQDNSGAVNLPRVKAVDKDKAAHMAQVYAALPKNDPSAKPAYDALNAEVEKQFQAIKDAGHTINFVDQDPYKNSKEMIADVRDNRNLNVFRTPRPDDDPSILWHGTPSGDLRGGANGLHVGTRDAAKIALEARIGIPAEGEWDGTREYGKTLLAGNRRLRELDPRGYNRTGANFHNIEEDYLPTGTAKYGDGSPVALDAKPNMLRVRVIGDMTNTPETAIGDMRANSAMHAQKTRGTAKRGYYYTNEGEGPAGNISAVVPSSAHLEVLPAQDFHPYMTPEQNDKFRAVHDWLAHAGEGHSFGPIGEENAYRVHSSTLSPLAQQALATETRGQNSWVNFGPNSHLPVTERPYAEQKAALWPKELLGDYGDMQVPDESPAWQPGQAQSIARATPAELRSNLLRPDAPMPEVQPWQPKPGSPTTAQLLKGMGAPGNSNILKALIAGLGVGGAAMQFNQPPQPTGLLQ